MYQNEIYYLDQSNWDYKDFDYLNSFITKIFQYKDKEKNYQRIKNMDLNNMSIQTKAIIKAYLNQQKIFEETLLEFPNLKELRHVSRLDNTLVLSIFPFNIFKEYEKMNILM